MVEKLTGDKNWVTCICGNEPHVDGFFTCNEEGKIVEPTDEEWTTNFYVCIRCCRYFDINTLEVVGSTSADTRQYNLDYDYHK
jgi:hypothetical protein